MLVIYIYNISAEVRLHGPESLKKMLLTLIETKRDIERRTNFGLVSDK